MSCPSPVLVGESPRNQQVLRLIDKLGRSRWPVLVLGETGTGKEVVARSIHNVVGQGPFVPIDCSALVGPLMESELFGHAKGAFTGAVGAKPGLLEAADGGTAFLDEVGELPLDLQVKLLRALQEKEFRPVGSLSPRRSDFRLVAATNRDLAREVEAGRFRRDLYYRLNVVTLRLAPLRERKEDVPALVDYFLQRHGAGQRLAPEALSALLTYDWPGNVRELENCVQRMLAVHTGTMLHMADLPSTVLNQAWAEQAFGGGDSPTLPEMPVMLPQLAQLSSALEPSEPAVPVDLGPSVCPVLPLAEVEKRAILDALRHTKGDRALTASLLGIGRTTLYRKLKEYGVE